MSYSGCVFKLLGGEAKFTEAQDDSTIRKSLSSILVVAGARCGAAERSTSTRTSTAATSSESDHRAVRRVALLPGLPCRDLRALAEDADGQRGA